MSSVHFRAGRRFGGQTRRQRPRPPKVDSEIHNLARVGDVDGVTKLASDPELVNSRDHLRRTPLIVAAWAGHHKLVEALLALGADGDAWAQDSFSALHFACMKGNTDVVTTLLLHGCNKHINQGERKKGRTPLHLATQAGSLPLVKLLLDHKANAHVESKAGKTANIISKTPEITSLLEEALESQEPLPKAQDKEDKARESKKRKAAKKADRTCPECGKQFSSRGMLAGHMQKEHGMQVPAQAGEPEIGVTMPPQGVDLESSTSVTPNDNVGGVTMPPSGVLLGTDDTVVGVTMPPTAIPIVHDATEGQSNANSSQSTNFLAVPQDSVPGSGGVGGWKKPPQISSEADNVEQDPAPDITENSGAEEPVAKKQKTKKKKKKKDKKPRVSLLSFM